MLEKLKEVIDRDLSKLDKRAKRNISALYSKYSVEIVNEVKNKLNITSDSLESMVLVLFYLTNKPPIKLNVTIDQFEQFRKHLTTL